MTTTRTAIFGDSGNNSAQQADVAQLVRNLEAGSIIHTGDVAYAPYTYQQAVGDHYAEYLATGRFFPSVGNHDISDHEGGLVNYLAYFADLPNSGEYYDIRIGPVHAFTYNQFASSADRLAQKQWLQSAYEASDAPHKIVFVHYPP